MSSFLYHLIILQDNIISKLTYLLKVYDFTVLLSCKESLLYHKKRITIGVISMVRSVWEKLFQKTRKRSSFRWMDLLYVKHCKSIKRD